VAIDLQTVLPQDVIPISRTRLTTLGGLRALELIGEDFRSVDEVRINDLESPDFVILGKNRLLAQLPDQLQDNPDVYSVFVLSRTFTITTKSLLRFRIGDTPGQVSGIMRLVQLFVKLLLSNIGSDITNKRLGGNALRNVGSTFTSEEIREIKADFAIAVDTVSRTIIGLQSRNGTLPRNERLLKAQLVGATYSKSTSSLFVNIEVLSQAGNSARMNLEL
jgi:hypothetical protein